MYVVRVIPIQKSYQKENLTYFSANDIAIGSIVSVPVRKKIIEAFVIDTIDAKELKSDLKNADFQLKKIASVLGVSPFSKYFLESCFALHKYNVTNTGSLVKTMLPQVYLDNLDELQKFTELRKNTKSTEEVVIETKENIKKEKLIFQNSLEERIIFYRTFIREEFARKQSVYICLPTSYDIENFKKALSRGIERYVYEFESNFSKKKLIEQYKKVTEEKHPVLIIGTGAFLCIKRDDIKSIILERESSSSYKQIARPFIDIRNFVEVFAHLSDAKLIFGDTILRPETLFRHTQNELNAVSPLLFRLQKKENEILIDMKEEIPQQKNKEFSTLSDKTKILIQKALMKNESVFLYTNRKGLAPCTVCHDCGTTLLCPHCELPIVLYNKKNPKNDQDKYIFMCNKCGRKEETQTRCANCNSWQLVPLGVGIDRVYKEVAHLFPDTNIFQIDKESSTNKEAQNKLTEFKKKSGIIIGTEMIFSYLDTIVDHSIIVSLDGLLSIPSYNMTQRILHTIENIHSKTKTSVLLQTRNSNNPILEQIFTGNILELTRDDLKEREEFGYPPYKRLIKISFFGNKNETEEVREYLNKYFKDYSPQTFSSLKDKINQKYLTNTILKIDIEMWPFPIDKNKKIDDGLYEKLRGLPPIFAVNVDPEDVL